MPTAPRMSGVRTTPEDVADVPITPCTNSGTNAIVPNIAIPTSATEATPAATVRWRKRSKGRMGSFTCRSTSVNSASRTAAPTNAPMTCTEPHAYWRPAQTSASRRDGRPGGEQDEAAVVDRVHPLLRPLRHRDRDDEEGEDADRQVDVEDPAPARVVDDEAAESRAGDRRGGERRADQPLVAATVARRDDHADGGEREWEEAARAEPLYGAEDRRAGSCSARGRRAPSRPGRSRSQTMKRVRRPWTSPSFPYRGHGHGRSEHVRRDDPGVAGQAADVADDPRQRGRDDRLVERGEHQHRHQPRRRSRERARS